MQRRGFSRLIGATTVAAALLLTACSAPQLVSGDADHATVEYSLGTGVAAAGKVARAHCARFDKMARMTGIERAYPYPDTGQGVVYFECR